MMLSSIVRRLLLTAGFARKPGETGETAHIGRTCYLSLVFLFLASCKEGGKELDPGISDSRPEVSVLIPDAEQVDSREPEPALEVGDVQVREEIHDVLTDDVAAHDEYTDVGSSEEEVSSSYDLLDLYDAPWTCEVDGTPCNDGDPCTVDDKCLAGVCKGKAMVCLDDGIPCTLDFCEGGQCVHPIKSAWCLINKKCYQDGDLNPDNMCEYCSAISSQTAWTPADGWLCSDQDQCTVGDYCEKGACIPGQNVCLPNACTTHAECLPDRVCGRWHINGNTYCSKPCAGPSECATDEICTHLPGSAAVGYCQRKPSDSGGTFGASCNAKGDCISLLCVEGVCGEVCAGQNSCSVGNVCFPAGEGQTEVIGACAPPAVYPQGLPFDFVCTNDGGKTYNPSLCLSGHCDLTASSPRCTRLCYADIQCQAGQECNMVLYAPQPAPDSILYTTSGSKTHDAILGCYTVSTGGYKALGQECSADEECRSNKCFAVAPDSSKKYCTSFCGANSHCPTKWKCRPMLLPLQSYWLQQPFSQAPKPDAFSLARICQPE